MRSNPVRHLLLLVFGVLIAAASAAAASCDSLASLKLPNTTITSANTVAAGAFTPPTAGGGANAASQFSNLPAFCRVTATLTPSSDSDIKVEVWLPVSGWNGKFQAVGNGGFAGVISYPALAASVKAGYASASTDTGHQGNTAAFALGHPEKVVDFADRAGGKPSPRRRNTQLTSTGLWPERRASTGCGSSSPVWPSTFSHTEAKTVTSRLRNMHWFMKPR
jgi:hypothetical protein